MNQPLIRRARASDAKAFASLMGDPQGLSGLLQLPYPSIEASPVRLAKRDSPGRCDLKLV